MELHWNRNTSFEQINGFVRKVLKPYKALTPEEFKQLAQRIVEFYKRLSGFNIPTPPFFEIKIEGDALVEYATDVGTDCATILRGNPERCIELVSGIVKASFPLLAIEQREVGFDSHPANWCVDREKNFTYVDFKPPRYCDNGVFLVGFPQPTDPEDVRIGTWRYYSREGTLHRLIFTCERFAPGKARTIILKTLSEIDPQCGQWAADYLNTLPPMSVRRNPHSFQRVVRGLSNDDVDDLRELAVVAVELFDAPSQLLEDVLAHSHVSYRKPRQERQAGFERARALLLGSAPNKEA